MRKITLVALAAALVFTALQVTSAQEERSDVYRQLHLFGEVFDRVRANYVDETSDEELIEAAVQGMLVSLDPHSSYLNPKSFRDMRVNTKGEFGGLGIEVTMENGFVKVVSPIDDTPAFHAGIESGDIITHLDSEPVLGMTLGEAVEKMRGPVNTDLILTIRREGREPFDVTITRDIIRIASVRDRIEGDIGYIRITTFNEKTTSGLEDSIEEIRAELGDELVGYVLDLRNNPGGLLDEAVSVSDAFLEQGEIVSTRGRDPNDSQRYNARKGDIAAGKPLVVLINGGSASASEIVAGALQDHRRAIVMGTRSFGKGSVQTIIPLGNYGGAMRLTTARYYTPSGRSIQATGIEPDIEVRAARLEFLDAGSQRREADLRGALDNPSGDLPSGHGQQPKAVPENGAETGAEAAEGEEPQDYQLARALDLLRGMALFRERAIN